MHQSIMAKNISHSLEKQVVEFTESENKLIVKEKARLIVSEVSSDEKSIFLPDHLEFGCEDGVQLFFVEEGKSRKYETTIIMRTP
jgi:hypothetical protein